MRKLFFQISLVVIFFSSKAQTIHSPINSDYIKIGTYSSRFTDVFSFVNNPACLPSLKKTSIGVYGEQRFLLKEASMYTMAFAVPFRGSGVGVKANYFGFVDFNETELGIAYGKNLGKTVDIGAQFNYYAVQMSGYGIANTVNFELGFLFHLTDAFHFGIELYNPIGGKFGKNGYEKLASVYKMGAGYEASKQVFVSAEIIKEENKEINVNVGLQYDFAKQFFGRVGVSSSSGSPYAGVGLRWDGFRLDLSVGHHPQMGFTPGLLLVYGFGKKE